MRYTFIVSNNVVCNGILIKFTYGMQILLLKLTGKLKCEDKITLKKKNRYRSSSTIFCHFFSI